MQSVKRDETKTLLVNIQNILANADKVELEFDVVPLDYKVLDKSTPKFFVSKKKLFFVYDDVIEMYDLNTLEISVSGDEPKFTLWQQLFEGNFLYTDAEERNLDRLRASDNLFKLSINDPNTVPRDFLLREDEYIQKSYKTWAMAQLILNLRDSASSDPLLQDMLKGGFIKFNRNNVLLLAGVMVLFFIIQLFGNSFLPQIVKVLLDFGFGGFLLFMIVWIYAVITKNYKEYALVYGQSSLKSESLDATKTTQASISQPPLSSSTQQSTVDANNIPVSEIQSTSDKPVSEIVNNGELKDSNQTSPM